MVWRTVKEDIPAVRAELTAMLEQVKAEEKRDRPHP